MFEINLVPDIKANMLKKQRASNLVLFICIIVSAVTAGVVLILGSIVGGQNIALANQDKEITCRSTGGSGCASTFGTAVLNFENVNDFLTIQDQMSKLQIVNENKLLLSRVFGVLDVLLPTGDEVVTISELNVNLADTTLNFDAQGDSTSNIDYKALEVFKKSAVKSYYDHGRYYRTDESGNEVEIPTMCIVETVQNGALYGIYQKGKAGCEAPLLPETVTNTDDPNSGEEGTENGDETTEEQAAETIVPIPIRRTYATLAEKDAYKDANSDNDGGYYFESSCIKYVDGKFSEDDTLEACPLLASEPAIRDSSNGRDSNDRLVLRFTATVLITKDVFTSSSRHMRIVGPSRQNVTDSYTQIRDMFTEKASDCDPEDTQCLEGNS